MTKRYRDRSVLTLVACLASTPAYAGSLDELQSDGVFRIANLHSPKSLALVAEAWDLDAVANADPSAVSEPRLAENSYKPAAKAFDSAEFYGPPPPPPPQASDVSLEPSIAAAVPHSPTGHVPREYTTHRGFFRQAGSVGTELALLSAYVGAQSIPKLFKPTTGFHFKNEGWFGKDTHNIGVDKLTHAYNTYLIAELLHYRIHRNTDGAEGDALTAGILAAGLMAINEISDAIEPDSGYSMQDVTMNIAGAAFSVLRNTVPGLKEKVAFKLEIIPNGQIYSHVGKKHYEQQRFMFSLKGAGFDTLQRSPFKYLDLQVGYYASDFLNSDRDKGVRPKRHLFVGVGLNLGELLFAKSNSRVGRAAYSVLDYLQVPYTSLRYDTTGRLGS